MTTNMHWPMTTHQLTNGNWHVQLDRVHKKAFRIILVFHFVFWEENIIRNRKKPCRYVCNLLGQYCFSRYFGCAKLRLSNVSLTYLLLDHQLVQYTQVSPSSHSWVFVSLYSPAFTLGFVSLYIFVISFFVWDFSLVLFNFIYKFLTLYKLQASLSLKT